MYGVFVSSKRATERHNLLRLVRDSGYLGSERGRGVSGICNGLEIIRVLLVVMSPLHIIATFEKVKIHTRRYNVFSCC